MYKLLVITQRWEPILKHTSQTMYGVEAVNWPACSSTKMKYMAL